MKIEEVIDVLLSHNYENVTLRDPNRELYENNLQVFGDKVRIIFIKEFRTESSFYQWTSEQAIIASKYNDFTAKQKKNLYFFMVLDFNYDNDNVKLEINKIEKDSYVCKKYILRNIENMNNIPFIPDINSDVEKGFDYITNFKDTITNIDLLHKDMPLNININREHYKNNIEKLVEFYFKKDFENLSDEELATELKKVLDIGENNDYK
ncbi:ABC-three component system middle component 1 [Solibacillus sp. FSL K6-4121]|uniref:ABC-three component system middle component 1 n=1 Tax=Solibacillus sp. FSL K6-4121 TaxID=2921505 RepID=UPI0030F59E73